MKSCRPVFFVVIASFFILAGSERPAHAWCVFGFGSCLPDEERARNYVDLRLRSSKNQLPYLTLETEVRLPKVTILVGSEGVFNFGSGDTKWEDGATYLAKKQAKIRDLERRLMIAVRKIRGSRLKCPEIISTADGWRNRNDVIAQCVVWRALLKSGHFSGLSVQRDVTRSGNGKVETYRLGIRAEVASADQARESKRISIASFGTPSITKIYEQKMFGSRVATAEFHVPLERDERLVAACKLADTYSSRPRRKCAPNHSAYGLIRFVDRSDGWAIVGNSFQLKIQ